MYAIRSYYVMKVQAKIEAEQKRLNDFDKKEGNPKGSTMTNDLKLLQQEKAGLQKRIEAQEMRMLGHEHYADFKNSEKLRARPQLDREAKEREKEKRRKKEEEERKKKEREEKKLKEKERQEKEEQKKRDDYLKKQEDAKRKKEADAKAKHEKEMKISVITSYSIHYTKLYEYRCW